MSVLKGICIFIFEYSFSI